MKNILLIGYFGYQNNQIDGQTIKTRLVGDIFLSIDSNSYDFFDTQQVRTNPALSIIKIILKMLAVKDVVIMPGSNGLRVIFPLIFIISSLFRKNIYYISVGGWLPLFLRSHRYIKRMLGHISGIYVESQNMNSKLKNLGLDNTKVFFNFRKIDRNIDNNNTDIAISMEKNIKIVFYSRVTKSKGVLDLLNALLLINNKNLFLDIYGPLDSEFEEEFFRKIQKANNVKYKGILTNNTYSILSQYKFMVFPTYYEGEGFAGAIIDAYISGLPVIATDWKYNSEFVKDNVTGLLYETRSIQDLRKKIELLIENVELYNSLKENSLIESNLYSFNSAKNFIKQNILC
jgi:glycosyltransferase involved in cell wall biosynthesis